MTNVFDSPLDGDVRIQLEDDLDLMAMAQALAQIPEAVQVIAEAVRLALTRDARAMGNLLGTWAQKQAPPTVIQPNTKKRLT